jgi:hypothetical protein
MMRALDRAAIDAAELKVAQCTRNTRDSLRRVRATFRATLARPATLTLIAGAAGLFGFWLARRPRPQATSASDGVGVVKATSAAGLVLAFLVRYGMQRLPFILRQVQHCAPRLRHFVR